MKCFFDDVEGAGPCSGELRYYIVEKFDFVVLCEAHKDAVRMRRKSDA